MTSTTAGATSSGIVRSSSTLRSGATTTPPLNAAIGARIASGSTSIAIPRGGRPLVIAKATPSSWSLWAAATARGVRALADVTNVPSTSASTADTAGGGGGASVAMGGSVGRASAPRRGDGNGRDQLVVVASIVKKIG